MRVQRMRAGYSAYRFEASSFLEGASRAFDIPGLVSRRAYRFIRQSDAKALQHDWEVVGQDLWRAIERIESDVKENQARQARLPLDIT